VATFAILIMNVPIAFTSHFGPQLTLRSAIARHGTTNSNGRGTFSVVYMTAIGRAGFCIVCDGSSVRRSLSLSNFVNNTVRSSANSANTPSVLFSDTFGSAVFRGNAGEPLWGNPNLVQTSSHRFVVKGCFFDPGPLFTAYQTSGATLNVTSWALTIAISAPNTL
jgi:hypothetical protein